MFTDAREMALTLIEREIGRTLSPSISTERMRVSASYAPLKHRPILRLITVQAAKTDWQHSAIFGKLPMADIALSDVDIEGNGVLLPQSFWGGYDEALITYEHGYERIPDGIEQAINIVAECIETLDMASNPMAVYQLLQEPEISALLKPFRSGTVNSV